MADPKGKDFELPQASINRILRAKLPEGISVTRDAKLSFAKAAGIFVLYVTAAANDFCKDKKRTTISAGDVLAALKELDFDEFLGPLEQCLTEIREQNRSKKSNSKAAIKKEPENAQDDKDSKPSETPRVEDEEEAEEEEETQEKGEVEVPAVVATAST